jgi:hypothetical protein
MTRSLAPSLFYPIFFLSLQTIARTLATAVWHLPGELAEVDFLGQGAGEGDVLDHGDVVSQAMALMRWVEIGAGQ